MGHVILTIKGKKKLPPEPKKGPILPVYEPEYLPRRDTGIYIRIYDLGQLIGGSDISFCYGENAPLEVSSPSPLTYSIEVRYYYEAAWNAFVFTNAVDDWESIYKEITTDTLQADYSTLLNGEGAREYVPNKGYKVEGSSRIYTGLEGADAQFGSALRNFNTDNTTNYKVTSGPTYASAEVDFFLDASCKVFISPVIYHWRGRPGATDNGWTPFYHEYFLNGFYKALPRTYFLNNAAWEAELGHTLFRIPNAGTTYPEALRDSIASLYTTQPESSLIKVSGEATVFPDIIRKKYLSHASAAPGEFPSIDDGDVLYDEIYGGIEWFEAPRLFAEEVPAFESVISNPPSTPNREGLFIAAIKKKGVWFYVWAQDLPTNKQQHGLSVLV